MEIDGSMTRFLADANTAAYSNGNGANAASAYTDAEERGLPLEVVQALDNADVKLDRLSGSMDGADSVELGAESPAAVRVLGHDPKAPDVAKALVSPYAGMSNSQLQEGIRARMVRPNTRIYDVNDLRDMSKKQDEMRVELARRVAEDTAERLAERNEGLEKGFTTASRKAESAFGAMLAELSDRTTFGFGGHAAKTVREIHGGLSEDPAAQYVFERRLFEFSGRLSALVGYAAQKYPGWMDKAEDDEIAAKALLSRLRDDTGIRTEDIPARLFGKTCRLDAKNLVNFFHIGDMAGLGDFAGQLIRESEIAGFQSAVTGQSIRTIEDMWRLAAEYRKGLERARESGKLLEHEATPEDRLRLVEHAATQADTAAGSSWSEYILNGIMSSIRFSLEMLATGGVSSSEEILASAGIKGLSIASAKALATKSGAKALGKASLYAIGNAAVRQANPLYVMSHIAEANDDSENLPVLSYRADTGEAVEIPPEVLSTFLDRFTRATVRDFIEVATENLGDLLPDINPAAWLSKKAQLGLLRSAIDATPNGYDLTLKFLRKAGVNGFQNEFAEEYIGQILQGSVSALGRHWKSPALDLGETSFFMGGDEALQTGAVILGQQTLMSFAGAVLGAVHHTPGPSYSLVARQNAVADAIRQTVALKTSVAAAEAVITESGSPLASLQLELPADEARALLASNPEAAGVLGLTEDSVAEAERDGKTLAYSNARLVAMMGTDSYAKFADQVRRVTLNLTDPTIALEKGEKTPGIEADRELVERYGAKTELVKEASALVRAAIGQNPSLRIDPDATGYVLGSMAYYLERASANSGKGYLDTIRLVAEKDPSILLNPKDLAPVGPYLLTDTPEARAAVQAVAKLLGVKDVSFVQRLLAPDGTEARGEHSKGSIRISTANGQLFGVFGHELGHSIWQNDKALAKSIYGIMSAHGTAQAKLVMEQLAKAYKGVNPNAKSGDEYMTEEHFCELLGYMLQDPSLLQKVAEELERARQGDGESFLRKVWDAVVRVFEAIRNGFASIGEETRSEAHEQLRRLFDDYERNVLSPVARLLAQYAQRNGTTFDGGETRLSPLRPENAPNNAESGKALRDSNVPHAKGFMKWAGLKGDRLYADYEFLYARHWNPDGKSPYFNSPEETRAAVELVLAYPEKVKDLRGNLSFVGRDVETGKIYRLEIQPKPKAKANHIRSVFEITQSQYEKIKLETSPVLQLSPTGTSAGRTISSFMMKNISQNPGDSSRSDGRLSKDPYANLTPEARKQYNAVVARYTKADGSKTDGWMKAPNGKPTNLTEQQWVMARTPNFKGWFRDWEVWAEGREQRRAKSISEAVGIIKSSGILNQPLTNVKLGITASISGACLSKMESEKATMKSVSPRLHALAIANVDRLFKSAFLEIKHPDVKGRKEVTQTHRLGSLLLDPETNEFVPVMLTVFEYRKDGNKVYSIEAVDVQKYENSAGQLAAVANGERQAPIAEFVNTISHHAKVVNLAGAPKVVDENGEPLEVYHGSEKDFWTFDERLIGTHTDKANGGVGVWGRGFYFSSNRADAEGYMRGNANGTTKAVFLDIRNPMGKEELLRLAKEAEKLTEERPEDFYTEYQRLIDESVEKNGYDGAVVEGKYGTEYVTFSTPNQIKSATDNNGEFSRQNNDIRYAIGNLYTGSGADYDKPSLHYIGTGEGSQVYGWGLYASSVRGIADMYADTNVEGPFALARNILKSHNGDKKQSLAFIRDGLKNGDFESEDDIKKAAEIIKSGTAIPKKLGNVYEQTFFTDRAPGDESHLLMWYEKLGTKQRRLIERQLKKEGLFDKVLDEDGDNYLEGADGETAYATVAEILAGKEIGSGYDDAQAKAASEFLARAGIDGVKYPVDSYGKTVMDGDKVGWNYVSFRDDNIRVDHKWTDGQKRYSLENEALWEYFNTDIRYAIGNLYTGSSADYDKPSLQYIGSGEGNQAYGWGLYASTNEGVARSYATPGDPVARFQGQVMNANGEVERPDLLGFEDGIDDDAIQDILHEVAVRAYESAGSKDTDLVLWDVVGLYRERAADGDESAMEKAEWLERHAGEFSVSDRHLYRQTWFTNRVNKGEANLLDWNGEVPRDVKGRVLSALYERLTSDDESGYAGGAAEMLRKELDVMRDSSMTGSDLYGNVSSYLGSDRAASEFLARECDMDGIRYPAVSHGQGDGSYGWNYVSFRDDNMRIDEHVRFSLEERDRSLAQFGEMDFSKALNRFVDKEISEGVLDSADRDKIIEGATYFFIRFARKKYHLSTGGFVYFIPDGRSKVRLGNDEALRWAEYCVHQVTTEGARIEDSKRRKRNYNQDKVKDLDYIDKIISEELVYPSRGNLVFTGVGSDGVIGIVTHPDQQNNFAADLSEVTLRPDKEKKESPPPKRLMEVVRNGVASRDIQPPLTDNSLPQSRENASPEVKNSLPLVPQRRSEILLPAEGTFAGGQQAIVKLLEGATDADVVHDSAVWLYAMVNDLVSRQRAGGGTDPMGILEADLDAIDAWIRKQPYNGGASPQEYEDFKREKFAEAFARYIINGKAPDAETAKAFSTLKAGLRRTYRLLRGRLVSLPPDVETLLATMVSAEDAAEIGADYKAVLSYLREQAAKGWLGNEAAEILRLVAGAEEQTVREQEKRLRELLARERSGWERQAETLADAVPVYRAIREITALGGISKELADAFLPRKSKSHPDGIRGALARHDLVKAGGRAGIDELATIAESTGFASIEAMLDAAAKAGTRASYVHGIINNRTREWLGEHGYLLDEKAFANDAMVQAMDRLETALRERTGGKPRQVAFFRAEAARRVGRMTVGELSGSHRTLHAAQRAVNALVRALGRKSPDFRGALASLGEIRIQLETLRQMAALRERAEKAADRIKKAARAKKGAIDGLFHDALRELAYCFGLTESDPGTGAAARQAVRTLIAEEASSDEGRALGIQMLSFAEAVYSSDLRQYRSLTVDDFRQLDDFSRWLEGAGRELVSESKEAFAAKVEAGIQGVLADTAERPHSHVQRTPDQHDAKGTVAHAALNFLAIGRKLYRDMEEAGATLAEYYRRLSRAAHDEMELLDKANRPLAAALNDIYDLTRGIDLSGLPEFRSDSMGPKGWTPEMVVMAVLYMGTESGRQRLMDGFGWRTPEESANADDSALDPRLEAIAAVLPQQALRRINDIWETLGEGELTEAVKGEFRKENHFDLETLPASPFDVHLADGTAVHMRGGYAPIRYMYSKGAKDVDQGFTASPVYQDAAGTHARLDRYAATPPVKLSYSNLTRHVQESAHYATHRMLTREIMRVLTSNRVRHAYGEVMGFERYDSMMSLVRKVANPAVADADALRSLELAAKNVQVAGALMANVKSVLSQLTSFTVGLHHFAPRHVGAGIAAFFSPSASMHAMEISAFMRNRGNMKDVDLRGAAERYRSSLLARAQSAFADLGYFMMKWLDMRVATMDFTCAYNDALEKGLEGADAVAAAEEFVARAQGGARALDALPVQLNALGRLMTPFISAVASQQNLTMHDLTDRESGALQKVLGLACNMAAPAVLMALLAYTLRGGWWKDDDEEIDKARAAALKELLSQPFAGVPIVRDIADYAAAKVAGTYAGDPFDVGAVSSAGGLAIGLYEAGGSAAKGDWLWACYRMADAVGSAFGMPAVKIYERQQKLLKRMGWDVLPDAREELKED